MNNLNLIKSALKKIEEVYRVHIVIKDTYSFMQTSPILRDLICTFCIHDNPYCMYVKSVKKALADCMCFEHTEMGRKMNTNTKLFERGSVVTCDFGVNEFYYPIRCQGHTIAALLVGCEACENGKSDSFFTEVEKKYGLDKKSLSNIYKEHISPRRIPNTEDFIYQIALCGELLSMLCDKVLTGISVEEFFKYDYILNDSNLYVDFNESERGRRILSRGMFGENSNMTLILNAISYIRDNYSQKITVSQIAEYCFCSTSTLSHAFAKNYGMTIGNLIHIVRCDRAKDLLRTSDLSIRQIAFECGFSSADYFSNVFKKTVGITPAEYRQKK